MGNKLIVNKTGKVVDKGGVEYDLSTVYGKPFLDYVNYESTKIQSGSDYINEIYLYFLIPLLEKTFFLKSTKVSSLRISGFNNYTWFFSAKKEFVKYSYLKFSCYFLMSLFLLFSSVFLILIVSLILPIYVFFKHGIKHFDNGLGERFAVVRSPASFSKMQFLKQEEVNFYCDSVVYNSGDGGIYQSSFSNLFSSLVLVPFFSMRDALSVFQDAKAMLGLGMAGSVLKYYIFRIPQKALFEFYFIGLIKKNNFNELFTGDKEDRFALLEKRLSKLLGIKTVCIPHGLEYSFEMPGGLVGDVFYCNTEYSRKYLESLYCRHENKFLYDYGTTFKMLAKHCDKKVKPKIVFFPESTDIQGNSRIITSMLGYNIVFFIKLHVYDSFENYSSLINESMLIHDFDEAISGNVCIARKSTVLLEALYNNSRSIAILEDIKDRHFVEIFFPSLNDKNIEQVYTFDELNELLIGYK